MDINSKISVVIPLFNKERTIRRAVESVLSQSVAPAEIIVVDDGSTDGSAAAVENIGSPSVRLLRQSNAGVSAARNRAAAEATGEFIALLDGDDAWKENYLEEICRLIEEYPDCGIYATGFDIIDGMRSVHGNTPDTEGIIDFFTASLTEYVVIPSAATLRRSAFLDAGGFPAGMRMGEDQYLWTKMARTAPVCFSPKRLVCYSRSADNRSAAIFRAEETPYSFEDLYDASADDASNEYIARAALGKALVQSAKGGTAEAARAIGFFGYTSRNRRALCKLKFINSLPVAWRQPVLRFYNAMAWLTARKGM